MASCTKDSQVGYVHILRKNCSLPPVGRVGVVGGAQESGRLFGRNLLLQLTFHY